MNCQNQISFQSQSETFQSNKSPIPTTPSPQIQNYERIFHSSQIKRPIINFEESNSNIFDINNDQNINQSFYSTSNYTVSNNLMEKTNNLIYQNNANNLKLNKSEQQEKYDSIKNYCIKKNDPDSYPLISYENFLLIDGLCEKNTAECELYKNFLLNKNASIELFSKFCTLLMNRFILSKQNNSLNKYPKVVYQIIFDINNIYNYLSPDIVADAKQSNMFIALVNYNNKWSVLSVNQNNSFCNYFMFNKNLDKDIIISMMNTITQSIYPYHNFQFTVSDYSGFSENNQIILPFIIMEFYSRYKSNLPIDDEDFYYQTILILSEIMTKNLITK